MSPRTFFAGAGLLSLTFLLLTHPRWARPASMQGALLETRYCGPPLRDKNGVIYRSSTVLRAFQIIHPCPSTGLKAGPCPGWSMNHVIPLACGGCDGVSNLDWMPNTIKSCAEATCRDRFERKIYAAEPAISDTAACRNQVLK